MALRVGTSGWAYPEWRGAFYPDGLPQKDFLSFYAGELSACEVNATFYRIQSAASFERWAAAVPAEFRFTVKAHRRITHRRGLAPDAATEEFTREFCASLAPLGARLGALLLQVPEAIERDDEALGRLLGMLPPGLPFACELQNASWDAPEVAAAVAERGGAVSVREEDGVALTSLGPGRLAYVRLKGEHYGDEARDALRDLFEREAAERDVYVFGRHKDVAPDDPHTGLALARWLAGSDGR